MPLTKKEQALIKRQKARAKEVEYLECRIGANGHRWQRCQPDIAPDYGFPIVKQCTECLCIKRQVVSPEYGEVLSETRQYPQGYLAQRGPSVPADERLISASAVRAVSTEVDTSKLPTVKDVLT